jgi:hypothetical protein
MVLAVGLIVIAVFAPVEPGAVRITASIALALTCAAVRFRGPKRPAAS